MKYITVLGSTGSIGTQTMDVIRNNNDMKAVALAVKSDINELESQIREFQPKLVTVWEEEKANLLRTRVADLPVRVLSGMEGLVEAARMETANLVVTALSGMIGIRPTIEAIKAGKDIALANKETLVAAGHLVMPLAREYGVKILPVDSEHCAVFQCLRAEQMNSVKKLIITASGGPFRGRKQDDLGKITVKQALTHPTWSMGPKISIDSATLVNKGLEVIEARWLFGVSLDQIEVVVQPQSIVHSMVEFKDGAVKAQLGPKDMREAIQYAMTYPERRNFDYAKHIDFQTLCQITFEKPDMETFKGLPLAIKACREGGSMPAVFNAANEWAVARFLEEKLNFLDIYRVIEYSMEHHEVIAWADLDIILSTEQELYRKLDEQFR